MQDLCSLNDKLQKAIGQLQLANESLRVSRQELCALDQQLDIMHHEVEILSREVVRLRDGYSHTLDHVPHPALMTDQDGKIEAWNVAAQQLFDLASRASPGFDLSEIPVQSSLRKTLSRKQRAAVEHGHALMLRDQAIHVGRTIRRMDVHFTSQGLVIFMSSAARDGSVGLSAAS
jgi:PAS domain-containing protein